MALHISVGSQYENAIPEHQQINLISGQHCPYFDVSHPENAIPEHQQIDPLAGWYCSYLKILQPENAIPDNQHLDPLEGRHCQYLNVSRIEKELLNIRRMTTYQDSTTHFYRFAAWIRDS